MDENRLYKIYSTISLLEQWEMMVIQNKMVKQLRIINIIVEQDGHTRKNASTSILDNNLIMSFSNNKDLTRIAEDRKIKKFDYNTFEDIKPIARGGFGSVNLAYSKDLKKQVALKCLHDENSDNFYNTFMNELQNIIAVNHHKNIVKYYGVSIDRSVEKCYLVLQYAKDDNLRNYLRDNFKDLNWETKIKLAQDITNGLCYIHKANIVHRDLHSKNVLVHEERLLIADLGLSKSLDANSNSFTGGMYAYSDPEYLRNTKAYKRSKASDIYSLGLQNIIAVNHHKNIVKYYGVSIDRSVEKCYLVLQYAKDDNLRNYLRDNFKDLNWETKIKLAQDITNGLCYIHKANIVHRDLHSKNVLVHEERLLIADLGLSKSLDANSNSFTGGMYAYSDPEYLRNTKAYKRSKASDIYSLGVIFWELSSGRPPFNEQIDFEIYNLIISGKRETPINGTPEDYIKIYSDAWKDNPNQRPTIEEICDSLKNIQFEIIHNNSNENNQYIQMEVYTNNLINNFKPMKAYRRDSVSIESYNQISFGSSINQENLEITVLGNPGKSSTLSLNSYDQEWLNNELEKYGYNVFENLEEVGESIHNATLMNGEIKVTLKSVVVNSMELFVNEFKKHLNINPHENIIKFYGISQKDLNSSNYILVLECSNDETLRNYLKNLNGPTTIKYFHSFDIVHGDMNSENIFIHNNIIKISNFGISKLVIEPSIDLLNSLGLIEYSDPILLKAEGNFSRTKASDIYSVGILLWEISSGNFPYYSYESKLQARETMEAKDESRLKDKFSSKDGFRSKSILEKIVSYIIKGNREIPILGTPQNYVDIYQDCWNQDPEQRPHIKKVIKGLKHVAKKIAESIEE
ncbi:hypothetical protein Glove_79g37 [Diversispora epigaea]|uniref:Protein kinase domain-containing protein n=1 Tax=Diversispora epigaea TaxID=1348612 RepID=A0A397JHF9_9GLOM|nr:hypothetical protein Glove_79g37 [Diversispora epigaea]